MLLKIFIRFFCLFCRRKPLAIRTRTRRRASPASRSWPEASTGGSPPPAEGSGRGKKMFKDSLIMIFFNYNFFSKSFLALILYV